MDEKINEIITILAEFKELERMQILVECASRIGSDEWAQEIRELIERMEKLKK